MNFEQKRAGFWIRFWAYIADGIIVSSLLGLIVYPTFRIVGWSLDETTWYAPIGILSAVVFYAYFVLMTKFLSQTVGKMIFGIRVQRLDQEKLDWMTVLFREWIGRFLSATIWPLYVIIAFTPKRQGIHDFIADTIVVHENSFEQVNHLHQVEAFE